MIAISTWRQLKKKKLRKLIRAWKDFVSNDMRKRRTILELFKWKRRDLLMRAWSTLKNITTWFGHTTAIRRKHQLVAAYRKKSKESKKLKYAIIGYMRKNYATFIDPSMIEHILERNRKMIFLPYTASILKENISNLHVEFTNKYLKYIGH